MDGGDDNEEEALTTRGRGGGGCMAENEMFRNWRGLRVVHHAYVMGRQSRLAIGSPTPLRNAAGHIIHSAL